VGWTIEEGGYAVSIDRVETRNGERLRIERADGSAAVELDAIELESLTVEDLDLAAFLGGGAQ
jgi:hypothetical protein